MHETATTHNPGVMDERPLAGVTVMVTRPAHQSGPFSAMVQNAGGGVVPCPTVGIADPSDTTALDYWIEHLDKVDIAVFVSPNAVQRGLGRILRRRSLPPGLKLVTVGQKSAEAIQRLGVAVDICPEQGFDSEALLEEPELQQVEGRKVLIFRGNGGRELLGATLKQRGAKVSFVECYRRVVPDMDMTDMIHLLSTGEITLVAVTSAEGLRNLCLMVGPDGLPHLRRTPLVLGGERMLNAARKMGFNHDLTAAADPSDEAMLVAIKKWAEMRNSTHE